jgi:hypothetical protein
VEAAYTSLVAPGSPFEIPLGFAQGMATIGDQLEQKVVFLFDEVDGPVEGIDGRVFLNLRALRDRHPAGLTYVTATNRRLDQIGRDPDVLEFVEMFERSTLYISMLQEAEIRQLAMRYAKEEDLTFGEDDLAYIRLWSGGHPALLEMTCRILGLLSGRPMRDSTQNWIIHRRATEVLTQDLNVIGECRKIWNDLDDLEQEALLVVSLQRKCQRKGSGVIAGLVTVNGATKIFSRSSPNTWAGRTSRDGPAPKRFVSTLKAVMCGSAAKKSQLSQIWNTASCCSCTGASARS